MWCILLPIFQQIECTDKDLCPYGRLEDTMQAFRDYAANPVLIYLSVSVLFTMSFFNGFGVAVTKNASSAQRATIDTARTLVIWLFFLIFSIYGKREDFYWLQLVGFLFLIVGTLVFNEIVVVPYLGFNLYTKQALALKAKLDMQEYTEKKAGEQDALVDKRMKNPGVQRVTEMNASTIGEN